MKGEMRLRRIVKSLTYKEHTRFTLKRRKNDCMTFGIHLWVADAVNPSEYRWLDGYFDFGSWWIKTASDSDIASELMTMVAYLELHEVYEFFKLDGKYFRNPHPEDPMRGKYPLDLADMFRKKVYADG